jgi:ABC-type molybdenum transport system ATPase subunit/photorepair protein PhrA
LYFNWRYQQAHKIYLTPNWGITVPHVAAITGVMSKPESALEIADLRFRFGNKAALDYVSFSVGLGRFKVLLGPKGTGKTTLKSISITISINGDSFRLNCSIPG